MNYTHEWLKQNPENFPVASRLLPETLRARIYALYAFARGADELADAGKKSPAERQQALGQLETALVRGDIATLPEFAQGLAQMLPQYPALLLHARSLLLAFQQDTLKRRYRDYPELKAYCEHSAVPIGRMMIILCDEPKTNIAAMDAFCHAMQLLNHIRDCADDYARHDRVYLPQDWFQFAGANIDMLSKKASTKAMWGVIHRGLDQVDRLLVQAKPFLPTLRNRSLRTEVAWMYTLAQQLSTTLRTHDPLSGKQRVNIYNTALCLGRALCIA